MSHRYMTMSTSHDMRIQTNTTRHTIPIFTAKLLQNGNIVDVDVNTEFNSRLDFIKVHAVGRIHDFMRSKPRSQAQLYFLYGNGI